MLSIPTPSYSDRGMDRVVEKIEVIGNKRTKKRVILNRLTFKAGESVTDRDIEISRQNLMNMELFSEVEIRETAPTPGGLVSVEVIVKEKWSILPLPVLSRTSDGEIRMGITYQDFNLGGRGHYLKVKVYNKWADDFDFKLGRHYSASLNAKNFMRTDFTLSPRFTKGNNLERVYEGGSAISSYRREVEEYGLGLGRGFGNFEAGISYTTSRSTYHYLRGLPQPYRDTTINSLGPYVSYNRIDNLGHYRFRGYKVSLSITSSSKAIGSDVSAMIYGVDFRQHIPLKKGDSIAYRVKGALVTGGSAKELLVGTGGSTSLRGYEKSEFEGNRMIQFNSEYRFPITARYWGGVLFIDGGNAWPRGDSVDLGDINWGVGLGLRLFIKQLVKGVGRLDFAYNESRNEYKGYLGVRHTF